ncbi:MAG: tRNA 2-thiouridine(34) synthase MnmA [Oscillospiraceae bacterium]
MDSKKSALIAMSGGVDSSTAAYLMLKAGFKCEGVTMRLYENTDAGLSRYRTCCSEADIEVAADAAFTLDIPFSIADYTAQFRAQVIEKFIHTYESGGTPNPCIDCNRYLKFGCLFDLADSRGLDCVVTGHYARRGFDEFSGRWLLKRARDKGKDQSYVLYMLTQEQLARIRFPLGELLKSEVRKIAESAGLINAKKRDSQDICFIPDGNYARFMERYTGKTYPEGRLIDLDGNILGRHHGAVRYTIGQRRGLGVSAGTPLYVCKKDMEENTVTLGPSDRLYSSGLLAGDLNWIPFSTLPNAMHVTAQTRYHQKDQPAAAELTPGGKLKLIFDVPQRAVTPGQAVVLYDGDTVLGGGTILEAF